MSVPPTAARPDLQRFACSFLLVLCLGRCRNKQIRRVMFSTDTVMIQNPPVVCAAPAWVVLAMQI